MGIFNRKSKQPLNEGNANNYEIGGLDSFNFIRGLRNVAADTYNTDYVLDRMLDDAIISSAIEMYIDDALQVDPQRQEIFWVEVDNTSDKLESELSKGLTKELNNFLKSESIAKSVWYMSLFPIKITFKSRGIGSGFKETITIEER